MIGVLFATEREARPFLDKVSAGDVPGEDLPTFRFSLRPGGVAGVVVCSGIGPKAAAAATKHLLEVRRVDWVVNAGIAGSTSAAVQVGRIFRISEAHEIDPAGEAVPVSSVLLGEYSPWQDFPAARLASCHEPVFDGERRQALVPLAELIDQEGAVVARVCRDAGVPCHLLKAVSDHADAGGREHLLRNIDAVSVTVAETLLRGLHSWMDARPGILGRLARFIKVEHTLLSLPLIFAGAWLGAGRSLPSMGTLFFIALAGASARATGMAANRIADRRLDALNPRTAGRDLPKGDLSLGQAYGVLALAVWVYLVSCAWLGPVCLLLSPVPLIPLLGYSYLKRFTCLCHFGIGTCLGLGPLAAYIAVSGGVRFGPDVLFLALFTFCWVSAFDIIYALQDLDSDRGTGVHSLPVRLGPTGAQIVGACVHGVALVGAAGLAVTTGGSWLSWACVACVGVGLALAYSPRVPLPARFFPLSAIVGTAGAAIPFVGVST